MSKTSKDNQQKKGRLLRFKIDDLMQAVTKLIHIRENNSIFCKSKVITSQMPKRGFAHKALNITISNLIEYEAIRLFALWDESGPDVISIPKILNLIVEKNKRDTSTSIKKLLEKLESKVAKVKNSDAFKSLKAFRNVYLGHNLDRHLYEQKSGGRKLKHGDITDIHNNTVALAALIQEIAIKHGNLCTDVICFPETAEDAREAAKALWHGVKINILR